MIDLTPNTEEERLTLEKKKDNLYKNLLIAVSFITVISLTLNGVVSYMSIKHLSK